jgi:cellobiose-specific phosphotransferase system component IIC
LDPQLGAELGRSGAFLVLIIVMMMRRRRKAAKRQKRQRDIGCFAEVTRRSIQL